MNMGVQPDTCHTIVINILNLPYKKLNSFMNFANEMSSKVVLNSTTVMTLFRFKNHN